LIVTVPGLTAQGFSCNCASPTTGVPANLTEVTFAVVPVIAFALNVIVAKTPSLVINWLPNVSSKNNNFIVLPLTVEEKFTDGFNTISPAVIDTTSNDAESKVNGNSIVAKPAAGTFVKLTGTATVSPAFTCTFPIVAVTASTGVSTTVITNF